MFYFKCTVAKNVIAWKVKCTVFMFYVVFIKRSIAKLLLLENLNILFLCTMYCFYLSKCTELLIETIKLAFLALEIAYELDNKLWKIWAQQGILCGMFLET